MTDTATVTQTSTELKEPSLWVVTLHNDDFTPFDFVIALLVRVFRKSEEEAEELATRVHHAGKAQVGRYTKEIALAKVMQSTKIAEKNGHPLLTTANED